MRIDWRAALAGIALTCVLAGSQGVAHAAEDLQLTEIRSARFPDRSFVLTLPARSRIVPEQVRLTENDAAVEALKVAADTREFGVVLVIDASKSMRGRAIEDAMAAARAFAARRRADQALGVVLFSRTPRVLIEPTTDKARIDAALRAVPSLTQGTRVYDAADAGVRLLQRAGIEAGSVVVLSDGADLGSAMRPADLGPTIRRADARVYSVGLHSPSYDSAALREIARIGRGGYVEASNSKELAGLFDALGERLASQYLLTYRSLAPLGARVQVEATIAGVDGSATALYQTPTFTGSVGGRHEADTVWTSPYAPLALSLLLAAIVGFVTFWLIGPRRGTVRSRIAQFVSSHAPEGQEAQRPSRPSIMAGAERSLQRNRVWAAIAEEIELARIDISPVKLAAWTLTGTVVMAYLLGFAAGRPLLAVASFGLPLAVWTAIRVKVNRERRAFGDQLAENLQVLASAMRAGHSFLGALAVMVDDAGEPSRREFRRVVAEEKLGTPIQQALATVARRMRNGDVEYVGLVAQLQTETGGNTAEVLDRVTETIRERNALHRLVRTLTAQGRLGGWVVSLLPVGLIFALNVINPNYLDPLVETGSGKVLLAIGASCVVAGMFVIRRIVDIKV